MDLGGGGLKAFSWSIIHSYLNKKFNLINNIIIFKSLRLEKIYLFNIIIQHIWEPTPLSLSRTFAFV